MISSIKNPWVRRPLVAITLPFVFGLDLLIGLLLSVQETFAAWRPITRRSWRGR